MPDNYLGKQVAGQFQIVQRIGAGGMGAVYKAEQPDMNRFVAIKILHPRYLSRADLVSRFRREARAMSHLSHPNTARVFLYGQLDDGACYFVMEYMEGRNLAQTVRAEGPMNPERAIKIMAQVCGALDEAHRAGIIHRDLKPENIFLTSQGGIEDFPKVLDFGLAKVTEKQMKPGSMILTREGMVFGTPEFMSPEQARGKQLDPRSDIYSLGVILYELLTGKLPFDAKQPIEYIQLHVHADPIPLTQRIGDIALPAGLEATLMRSLEKEPDARFTTAGDFAEALEAVARGVSQDNGPNHAVSSQPVAQPGPHAPQQAYAQPQAAVQPLQNGPGAQVAMSPVQSPSPVHVPSPQSSSPQSPSPVHRDEPVQLPSRLPWLVLGLGLVLALAGAAALAVAFTQ